MESASGRKLPSARRVHPGPSRRDWHVDSGCLLWSRSSQRRAPSKQRGADSDGARNSRPNLSCERLENAISSTTTGTRSSSSLEDSSPETICGWLDDVAAAAGFKVKARGDRQEATEDALSFSATVGEGSDQQLQEWGQEQALICRRRKEASDRGRVLRTLPLLVAISLGCGSLEGERRDHSTE